MSKHITEWLNAYLDGELHGSRLQQVEAHLAECRGCQSELGSLERLSGLLHEIPAPEVTPPERFAAQVNLCLPHRQTATYGMTFLEIGWWMIPVGLLATWIFISTSFLISDMLSAANNLGLLNSISDWLFFGSASQANWSATLGQLGILSGNSLDWAASTEAFTKMSIPQVSLQISIALLYLSWIVIWWARHAPPGYGQPLES